MAEWIVFPTADYKAPGSNPAGEGAEFNIFIPRALHYQTSIGFKMTLNNTERDVKYQTSSLKQFETIW